MTSFADMFAEMPLVAIVRGVRAEEILDVAEALHAAGIRIVEVPLNSPDPLRSIHRLAGLAERMVGGAGTVLRATQVDEVVDAGGTIIVSPNTDAAVIRRTVERGATSLPGIATATDAFAALAAGATHLKLFPAASYGPGHIKALSAVLPGEAVLMPVGGVSPANMADWWAAGARGFGLGSDVYKPGMSAREVGERAAKAVAVMRTLR